jgi:hypothetical protein
MYITVQTKPYEQQIMKQIHIALPSIITAVEVAVDLSFPHNFLSSRIPFVKKLRDRLQLRQMANYTLISCTWNNNYYSFLSANKTYNKQRETMDL